MSQIKGTAVTREEAIAKLWHKGVLSWKLKDIQNEMYSLFYESKEKINVWLCGRRIGKSYTLCTLAVEMCLKKPNTVVKYAAPTKIAVKMIIKPLIRQIIEDCPKELQPKLITGQNTFIFPNGSEIQMAGTDSGSAENLRGGSSDLCIVDEAGFIDELEYLINSILLPTTLLTGGKIILSSTPPKNLDHKFMKYVERASFNNTLIKKTVHDSGRITEEMIAEMAREYPLGTADPEFRREYLVELLTNAEKSVVPEFTAELQKEIIKEWQKPAFYDCYVAGDIGFKDLTVMLFAYLDFSKDKIVIEDEIAINGTQMTTAYLAELIKEKEAALWTNPLSAEQKEPYLRVCDNNLIVINDLWRLHGILFQPTDKDDSDAALNNMKIMMAAGKIIIHPRCKVLIKHLQHATWSKNRRTYDRSPDNGHYDAIDALKYLIRNIVYTRNPYPKGHFDNRTIDRMKNPYYYQQDGNKLKDHLKSIFQVKKINKY